MRRFCYPAALLAVLLAGSTGLAQDDRSAWPRTCDDAISTVFRDLDEESKKRVRATPREDLIMFHHGWGTGIRNAFGLWRGNIALMESCLSLRKGAEPHPDTVSMIIIEGVWERLNRDAR